MSVDELRHSRPLENGLDVFLILNTLPVRAKVINNRCAHTFALTGRRALYADTQCVALSWGLAALSGRSRRQLRGIAPERGSYSRIGACPYLPPQLINSRCCPCKGRISWAGLAPQYLSRYEPLTGARFINRPQEVGASPYPKYEPPSGALAPQVRDIRAALRGLKAQQVRSPGQRPGLTYVPHLRPVRAKVKANRSPILLPLQGEGLYTLIPRALPWAGNWLPFQGARGAIRHYSPQRGHEIR